MSEEITTPRADWLRSFVEEGDIPPLREADMLLLAEVVEMLSAPESAITMRREASMWQYPEYRIRSYFARLIRMFEHLREDREKISAPVLRRVPDDAAELVDTANGQTGGASGAPATGAENNPALQAGAVTSPEPRSAAEAAK